jgi:hypothetical protein
LEEGVEEEAEERQPGSAVLVVHQGAGQVVEKVQVQELAVEEK